MRLTTKLDGHYRIVHNWSERNTFEDQNKEELATRKLGQLEDLMEKYNINTLFELELYICGFNKEEVEFYVNYHKYQLDYLAEHIYVGKTKHQLSQKAKYLRAKLKKYK